MVWLSTIGTIETGDIAECQQALLQIGLNHVHTAADGSNHAVGIDFHAIAAALFVRHQRQ